MLMAKNGLIAQSCAARLLHLRRRTVPARVVEFNLKAHFLSYSSERHSCVGHFWLPRVACHLSCTWLMYVSAVIGWEGINCLARSMLWQSRAYGTV